MRVARPALHEDVHDVLKRGALVVAIERPCLPVGLVFEREAEQVLETAHSGEGIAFEVEKHVTRRGSGQARQAASRFAREQFSDWIPADAGLELDSRLLTDAHISLCSAALGPPRSEEHTSELQSPCNLVCRLLLEKKKI